MMTPDEFMKMISAAYELGESHGWEPLGTDEEDCKKFFDECLRKYENAFRELAK